MKNILIVQGHPDRESYCYALAHAYQSGAKNAGASVKLLHIGDMEFNMNLQYGYRQRMPLEPCLEEAQDAIKWADHLVLVHPVWWGSVPAVMKGFLDRVLLPGFAFKKRPDSLWWDKLLKGKTARIIATMDQPAWYYWLVYRQPSNHALKKLTLEFCGIEPVRITNIGPLKHSKATFRAKWLKKVEKLGTSLR
jgi:NAD(P)H dehydrogenase (quinone)